MLVLGFKPDLVVISGDQWWPVFEQPPDAFDVINYTWAVIM